MIEREREYDGLGKIEYVPFDYYTAEDKN